MFGKRAEKNLITASFDTPCDYCDEFIEEGDSIWLCDGFGWVHEECGE